MKKLFSALALFAMTLAVPSCNVEEPEPTNGNVEFLNITYKDKRYKSVPTTYGKDGQFVFLDKEFSAVYNAEISQLPNLSIFVADEHDIEFYSSLEETFETKNLKFVSSVPSNLPQTRSEIPIGSVDIFDKRDCAGDHIMFYLNKPHQMPGAATPAAPHPPITHAATYTTRMWAGRSPRLLRFHRHAHSNSTDRPLLPTLRVMSASAEGYPSASTDTETAVSVGRR